MSGRVTTPTVSRALALACAAVLLGTTFTSPALAAGQSGARAMVAHKKPPPPPPVAAPPLKVEPIEKYRPESTGGYAAVEYGQVSIGWRITPQRDGAGKFKFTFPAAPRGAKGFGPLRPWVPGVTPPGTANIFSITGSCGPKVTKLVSGKRIDQSIEVAYPKTCKAGVPFILGWRGPLTWNGYSDTNGADIEPNPADHLVFPVKMWSGNRKVSTTTSIELLRYPAKPIGLEPVEFIDPVSSHSDASLPLLMIDMVATPVYVEQTSLSAWEPAALTAAGRDSTGTPIEANITIIAAAVLDQNGNLVEGVTPYLADPNAALDRTVFTPIVVDGGCATLNVGCPAEAQGYIPLAPDGYIDQRGDPIPGGYTITMAFVVITSATSNQIGSKLLCESYGGVYGTPAGQAESWYCADLRSPEVTDRFATEILTFRPQMGSWYCSSRVIAIDYPGRVYCYMGS